MSQDKSQLIYFNTAAIGLLSKESVQTTKAYMDKTLTNPSGAFFAWMENDLPNLRKDAATLMGTQPENVAFTPNFSFALQSIIGCLTGRAKKVLLFKEDYPSLNLPFELGDFEIHYVESKNGFEIKVDDVKQQIEKNQIEILAISHTQFLNGFTIDIEMIGEYCKEKGVIFILDATQTLGASDIDFGKSFIDVLISSSYKWLNGGMGSAVMAVKDDFLKKFQPKTAGFGSMTHTPDGWFYKPSIISFEPGHMNVLGLLHLQKAIEQRLETGIKNIMAHNKELTTHLLNSLPHTGFVARGSSTAQHLSTIVCIEAGIKVQEYLKENRVMTTWRKGLIRVSPHYYNTLEEIDRFIDLLKNYPK